MQSVENMNTPESAASSVKQEPKRNKAGHPELTKRQKAHIGIGLGVTIPLILVIIFNSFGSNEPEIEPTKGSVVSTIETKPGKVSPEQMARIETAIVEERQSLDTSDNSPVAVGIFDIALKNNSPMSSQSETPLVSANNGISVEKPVTEEKQQTSKKDESERNDETTDTSQKNQEPKANRFSGVDNIRNQQTDNSKTQTDYKKKFDAFKRINESNKLNASTAKNQYVQSHQMFDTVDARGVSNKSSSPTVAINQNLDNNKSNSKVRQSEGRGFFSGDIILAKTRNGLTSTHESQFLTVDIIHGPLEGARMVFKPQVSYDTYVFESQEVQLGKNRAPVKAIIVTPDANVQNGYRSDVDYHTLYKLGMLWVYGASKGAATLVNNFSNSVSKDNNTTVITSDYGTKEIVIASAGGVADASTELIKKETTKPPTVTVVKGDTIGVMFIEAFNPEWLMVVDDSEYSL
ncbi:hypothetical protein G6355_11045 [Vibrio cholerae]|uniref:hypothetical protein n=1 Tax=Vibrio cholerae TaxID=666 RepID=UPI002F3376D0